jgi:hypothetical protein
MRVTHEYRHPIEQVFKTLTDATFLKQRALALGGQEANCAVSGAMPNYRIELVRQRQINIPAVLSAFLKKIQTATTAELWPQNSEKYSCQNTTDIDGAPLTIKGSVSLVPNDSGCIFTAEFESKAKIMFGKKTLQQYAGETILKELQLECQYTEKHLASQVN